MPGISYMAVRGVEFPLWFVILILILVVGAFVFMLIFISLSKLSERRKERKNSAIEKNETMSYMGKDRLMKILSHYILGRYGKEMHNSFIFELKECKPEKYYAEQKQFFVEQKNKTGVFYMYTQTNGFPACNEWLKCLCLGHDFIIEACGKKTKRVTITDYYKIENQAQCDYIFTYYDENFVPKPNETQFYNTPAQTPLNTFIKPFTDENTTYNGIERDVCVCYDIAKTA